MPSVMQTIPGVLKRQRAALKGWQTRRAKAYAKAFVKETVPGMYGTQRQKLLDPAGAYSLAVRDVKRAFREGVIPQMQNAFQGVNLKNSMIAFARRMNVAPSSIRRLEQADPTILFMAMNMSEMTLEVYFDYGLLDDRQDDAQDRIDYVLGLYDEFVRRVTQ